MNSERPPPSSDRVEDKERERRRLERILPELIKRIVETGYEKISEGPENVRHFVSEMKLPKEALALILAQLDETKNGLYRVVAKEIRDFLEHTNLAEEMSKVLTTLSFEVKTEVRFIPNDSRYGAPRPDVRSRVRVKKDKPEAKEKREPEDDADDPAQEEPAEAQRATPTPRSTERHSDRPPRYSEPPPPIRPPDVDDPETSEEGES